jgi:hypothetical protein
LLRADLVFVHHTLAPILRALDAILRAIFFDGHQTDNRVAASGQAIEPPAGEIFYGLSNAKFVGILFPWKEYVFT